MSIPPSASVTYRLPVVASIGSGEALAGLGINHDALGVSPEVLEFQLVPFGSQNIYCIGREAVLDENSVREPLVMKPWCVDGCLNIKFEIDDSDEHVGDGRDDGGAAGRA